MRSYCFVNDVFVMGRLYKLEILFADLSGFIIWWFSEWVSEWLRLV